MEDATKFSSPSNTGPANENDDQRESGYEATGADFLPLNSEVKEEVDSESVPLPLNSEVKEEIDSEPLRPISDGLDEDMDLATTDVEEDEEDNVPTQPGGIELTESVAIAETMASISTVHTENGSLAVLSESSFKEDVILLNGLAKSNSLSGKKRRRMDVDEQQPSVHVIYNSLTRESKQKLEELLQQWSRWDSQNCKSSNDSNMVLESGEETYFPALNVGLDKSSAVTFWVDNQTKIQSNKEFHPLDGTSVPLYDRGYSSALTSADGSSGLDREVDASRCFNCGSYSHALKDCPKPRDNVAVNNARKQHKSRRSQQANFRNSTRYYQTSRGGKYDGLTPGVLDAETRQLLGLGELDPPPWLNRMRELGYPPGYLDADIEDQPSGITIFGDETNKQLGEGGEILDSSQAEPPKKKSVEFPGINAPIPEKADKLLWLAGSSNFNNNSREQSHHRYNHSSESFSRGQYTERRWNRDLDDEGPPGCDPWTSPSLSNYYHKYGDYDSSSYSPFSPTRLGSSGHWSPGFGRTLSDRGWRSPLVYDGPPDYGRYDTLPYSSPRYNY